MPSVKLQLDCRAALQNRDYDRLGSLMSRNFDLRRRIFGDAVLGATNLRMVELVRAAGGMDHVVYCLSNSLCCA